MLEEYERAPQLRQTANGLGGLLAAPALARTAQPGPPTPDGHGCSNQRVELASELKFEKPVEVVHLY